MTSTPSQLLVVGWDGATFDLIEPWIAAGELPHLARLMREGAHGRLRSVPNMNSGPAWTTVTTGLNPGEHGIHGLVGFVEGSYRQRPLNAHDRRGETIWQPLGRAGKRVVAINFPLTYPAEPVNGVLVAGGDAPSAQSPGFTYPEGLLAEINAQVGEYILAARVDGLIRAGRQADALDKLHRMIEGRTRAALYLMEREAWDLFMVLFTASDMVQHYFWRDLSGGPFQDAILSVFRHLDEALGALLARAGDRVPVIVLSDHGFGPARMGSLYLNDFLAGLGLLCYKPRRDSSTALLRWAFLQLERRLGERTKEWLLERFPHVYEKASAGLWVDGVDWSTTRAFSLSGTSEIWVNLRGRQPEGIVAPGEDYAAVVAQIERTLAGAVDPLTGRPAVKAVRRRTDVYHGPFVDQAADLFVEWVDDVTPSGLAWYGDGQPVVTTRKVAHRRHLFNGGHREMGILVARGAPFKPGAVVDGATLYDIAPTLLFLLDQPVPACFAGRPLVEAFADEWLRSHRPRFASEDQGAAVVPPVIMSAEDEEKVMERLRALGYVE